MMSRICIFILIILFISAGIALAKDGSFKYDDKGKRDPFWKLVSPSGTIINYDKELLVSEMVIEGIMAGEGGDNIAIINGTIVKVNDTIGMFTVKRIETNKVVLEKDNKEFILNLKKEE